MTEAPAPVTPEEGPSRSSFGLLVALNRRLRPPLSVRPTNRAERRKAAAQGHPGRLEIRRSPGVYAGTVPAAEKARRRAAGKTARHARRLNRGDR